VYRNWRPAKKRWLEQQTTFDVISEGWSGGKKVRSHPFSAWRVLVACAIMVGVGTMTSATMGLEPTMIALAQVQPSATSTIPSETYTPTLPPTDLPTETPTVTPEPTVTATQTPFPEQAFNWQTNIDDNPLNGYFQPDRGWIPGLIDDESWNRGVPIYSVGGAVWYSPNVMEGTARYRKMPLENYVDGVSLMAPSDIGETVWLRRPGHDWEGPFLVVDCAQINHHFAAVYYAEEVVEVGWTTALRWGMVDERQNVYKWRWDDVEVWKGVQHPPADPGTPVDYREWWLSQVTFQLNPENWSSIQ